MGQQDDIIWTNTKPILILLGYMVLPALFLLVGCLFQEHFTDVLDDPQVINACAVFALMLLAGLVAAMVATVRWRKGVSADGITLGRLWKRPETVPWTQIVDTHVRTDALRAESPHVRIGLASGRTFIMRSASFRPEARERVLDLFLEKLPLDDNSRAMLEQLRINAIAYKHPTRLKQLQPFVMTFLGLCLGFGVAAVFLSASSETSFKEIVAKNAFWYVNMAFLGAILRQVHRQIY